MPKRRCSALAGEANGGVDPADVSSPPRSHKHCGQSPAGASAGTRTVIRCGIHRGKGAAVRSGVLASQGEYVLFADSGVTVPFDNALNGLRGIIFFSPLFTAYDWLAAQPKKNSGKK